MSYAGLALMDICVFRSQNTNPLARGVALGFRAGSQGTTIELFADGNISFALLRASAPETTIHPRDGFNRALLWANGPCSQGARPRLTTTLRGHLGVLFIPPV